MGLRVDHCGCRAPSGKGKKPLVFKQLTIASWRQFELVELDFHPRLTVITGANGSGKTTILHLLSQHYEWQIPFVNTRRRNGDKLEYDVDRRVRLEERWMRCAEASRTRAAQLSGNLVGRIEFADGPITTLS